MGPRPAEWPARWTLRPVQATGALETSEPTQPHREVGVHVVQSTSLRVKTASKYESDLSVARAV